jgi:hypothetical protein
MSLKTRKIDSLDSISALNERVSRINRETLLQMDVQVNFLCCRYASLSLRNVRNQSIIL